VAFDSVGARLFHCFRKNRLSSPLVSARLLRRDDGLWIMVLLPAVEKDLLRALAVQPGIR
jgi:hypothetical protein